MEASVQSPTMEMTSVSGSFGFSMGCTGCGVSPPLARLGVVIGSFVSTLHVITVTHALRPMAITSTTIKKIPDLESFMASPFFKTKS